MKRLSWNGVIFALAVCLIPAAASATEYTYTIYVPYNLTAIGPPGYDATLSCGINKTYQDFVPWSANQGTQGHNLDVPLDHTGSARGTLQFVITTSEPYRYYRCVFLNRLWLPGHPFVYPKLPQSMLRGVSGTLPDATHYRPMNGNQMQMNRRNATIPPPMQMR